MAIKKYFVTALFVSTLIAALTSCDTEFNSIDDKELPAQVDIIEAKLNADGEPDGFRGKAIEFVLDRVLEENSEVSYEIEIETNSGFLISGDGFLTTPRSLDQPTERWLINVYLWVPRGDPLRIWNKVEEEVIPGNIKQLKIRLTEKQIGFSKPTTFTVIADKVFNNL